MPWTTTNTAKGDNKLYSDAKGVVPSLDLRFASQKNLNDYMTATPLVDHQRSMSGSNLSAGTFVNSSGLIETAKVNLVSYSQEFENSYYTKANITTMQATTDVAAPDGTFTARYISGASNGRFTISSSNFTSQSGRRKSIYLRAVSGSPVVNALTQAATDPNPVTLSSTEWLRFEIDTPSSEVGGTTFVLDFRGSSTTTEVYAWGLQIEEGSAATTYIPTTNVPSAAPRFDHDPTTGESLGLLIEESRTNLFDYSTDLTKWTGSNSAPPVASSEIAPDGSTDAYKLNINIGGGSYFTRNVPTVTGSVYTISVWAKNVPGEQNYFDLFFNTAGSVQLGKTALTDTWTRYHITGTATQTGNVLAGINNPPDDYTARGLFWGFQFELGSFATSYIPTTGTALTRSADLVEISGADFSSWYNQSEGSIFADSITYDLSGLRTLFSINDGGLNNRISSIAVTYAMFIQNAGITQVNINAGGSWPAQQSVKSSYGIAVNDFSATVDGSVVGTDNVGTLPTVNQLKIGVAATGGSFWNGTISRLTYFPERLPDATLQAITAP